MQPDLDLQIQRRLADYLDRRITLRDFEEWFAPIAWDVDASGNGLAESLVGEIELRLAEHGRGHWTEVELREILESLAATRTIAPSGDIRERDPRGSTNAPLFIENLTLPLVRR